MEPSERGFTLLLLVSPGQAQEAPQPQPPWKGDIGLSFVSTTGTVSLVVKL